MENTRIKCTINDIINMKNVVEENNKEILECLKLMNKDYEEMPNILNTPNSSKIVPFMNQNIAYYTKVFDTIINEYNEFMVDTQEKVGGGK